MQREFVERRDGGLYLTSSRVPLDNIVRAFRDGEPAEAIRTHFPTLSLEQVYGAITFYLGNTAQVDAAMREREKAEDAFTNSNPAPSHLKQKLAQAQMRQPH